MCVPNPQLASVCVYCRLRSSGPFILFPRHNWQRNPRARLARISCCSTVWHPKHRRAGSFYSWHEHVCVRGDTEMWILSFSPLSVSFLLLFTSETEAAVPAWACNLATQMVCVLNKSDWVPPPSSSGVCRFTSPPCYHMHATTHAHPCGNTCAHAHRLLTDTHEWLSTKFETVLFLHSFVSLTPLTFVLPCLWIHQQRTLLLSNAAKTAEVLVVPLKEPERHHLECVPSV